MNFIGSILCSPLCVKRCLESLLTTTEFTLMDTPKTFHVWQNSQSQGPFTIRVMQEKLNQGSLSRETLVAQNGSDEWVPLGSFADLIDPPKMDVIKPPAPAIETQPVVGAPLTVAVAADWLLRAALIFVAIGVGLGMTASMFIGLSGFWFCVGPFSLALTVAIFGWCRP